MKIDYVIFTDASVRKDKVTGKCFTGYAYVILNVNKNTYITYSNYLTNDSIVFAEAWAIYSGLRYVSKHIKNSNILVVSDSKLNIDILTNYIPNKWNMTDKIWRKSDGKPVKNQKIYQLILKLISNTTNKLKFVHINSHKFQDDSAEIILKFKKYKVSMNKDTVNVFINMNSIADKLATTITGKLKHQKPFVLKYLK